jgi:hypothetical protein
MCIPREALVSGLLLRIERDGYTPTEQDFASLLALGVPRADLSRALAERGERRPDRPFAQALATLGGIAAG